MSKVKTAMWQVQWRVLPGMVMLIGLVLAVAGWPASGQAQACTQEVEPNEQPATATAAPLGCVEGSIQGGDQDFYAFQFSAQDAAQRWTLGVQGVPGQTTTVQLFLMPTDGSEPKLVAKRDLPAGAAATLSDLLFMPGTYVAGIVATGDGAYRLDWQPGSPVPPNGDVEPNEYDTPTPVHGVFALSGDLQGSNDNYRWTVSESDAQQLWRIDVQSPLGNPVYVNIAGPAGSTILSADTQDGGALASYDLGLAPGDYTIGLSPPKDQATPYVVSANPVGPRSPTQEEEPDDRIEIAYPLDPQQPMHGTFQPHFDPDIYRFKVDDAFAAQRWSLTIEPEQAGDFNLCLLDRDSTEVQCREGAKPELVDLALAPGEYAISVRDSQNQANRYVLKFKPTGAASADLEAEPNDLVTWASPLNHANALRGRLVGSESDFLRLTVTGAPQLWRVQVAGDGLERLDAVDVTGNALQSRQAEGGRRIRLENLYLLPGDHYFRVVGQDGKYTVRAVPLGAPADAPLTIDQAAAFTSTTAPTATVDFDAGPPPIPVTEREPNDTNDLALRIDLNSAQSGRLSEGDERDVYRFYLPAAAHVRITVVPPGDAAADLSLDDILSRGSAGPGQPYAYEAFLAPGDHFIALTPDPRSDQPYQLWLQRLNWFVLPADLEPANNSPLSAPLLRASGIVTGMLDNGDTTDYYRLPAFPTAATPVTITLAGTPSSVDIYSGTESLNLLTPVTDQPQTFAGTLPQGPLALRVYGTGAYTLGVEAAGLPGAEAGALDVALGSSPAPAVAAYWPYAQQVDWTLLLTNTADTAQSVTLDFHSSDANWTPTPVQHAVTLAAGSAVTVPVQLVAGYDAQPGSTAIDVSVRDSRGAQQVASFTFDAVCGVDPVAPNRRLTTAGPLFGGLNVAWSGLGGQPGGDDPARSAPLFDAIVAPSTGFYADIGSAITVTFTSTQPIPVAGVLLNPFGSTLPPDTLRNFVVAASLDGTVFTPVYTGTLGLLPVEQAFAFSETVPARAVSLTLVDSYNEAYPSRVALGEFKVVATPGTDVNNGRPFNLADPAAGGHVVAVTPLINDVQEMLMDDQKEPSFGTNDATTGITFTLGFNDERAAQITALEWQNRADGDPTQRLNAVDVAVSVDSPVGPWTDLGTWALEPNATAAQRFDLPAPVWARYVQLRVPAIGRTGNFQFADVVRVFERAQDPGYTSILAEYGEYRRQAIYEQQADLQAAETQAAGDNGSRETAAPLAVGEPRAGAVQANVQTDWYRIEVPADQNTVEITLTGEPALAVDAELYDATGAAIAIDPHRAGNTLQLKANVAPGTYYLQVSEPRRSVVFTWDTSGSVGPYTTIIYQALAAFTHAIDPQFEVVNLLPFGEPGQFLLPDWSGDPLAVQTALNNYGRGDSSSNAEWNLLTATDALGQRAGTRAVVLITDAESNGYDKTPELWAALDSVRPRVFSFEISSGGSAASQDLMQDWADVNAGHYAHVTSIGDMETGFDRAACLLRQPARYTVALDLRNEAPPTPTPTPTAQPTPTPAPTATPTPEPTREFLGTGQIAVAAPAAAAEASGPAGSAAAAGGAVEIILDASGSMLQQMEGQRKIEIARGVLTDLVNNELPPGAPVALRVFGNREADSCRTDLEIPLQPLDRAAATQILQGITAINLARTPIADSLRKVADDLAGATGPRVVVLVTDGEETCNGDPAQVIRDLRSQGYDVRVNIVGFDVADPALQALFQEWAKLGGGVYINAADAAELGKAVVQAVRPAYRITDASGNVIATGVVGGDPVAVPAGIYAVDVDSAPPVHFEGIRVQGDQTIQLQLPPAGGPATPAPASGGGLQLPTPTP